MSTLEPGKFKPGKFNHIISPRKAKGLVVRSNYTVIKTTYFLSKSKKTLIYENIYLNCKW